MHKFIAIFTLALTLGLAACLVVIQPFPLLHDFLEWMYQGWLFNQLSTGTDEAIAVQYALVNYPVPNSLSQVAMGLLNTLVSPALAGKIWLGVYLGLATTLWVVAQRRSGDALQQLLLTSMITFGPGFWNGYINFQFALLLFALYLLIDTSGRQRSLWLTLLFSILLFFSHATVFLVFALYCVASILLDRSSVFSRRVIQLSCLIPSALLFGWYSIVLLSSYAAQNDTSMGLSKWVQYKAYTLAKQGPFHNFIQHNGKSLLDQFDLVYKAGFVANFAFAGLLVLWLLVLLWSLLRGRLAESLRSTVPVWPLLITLAVCFVIYLVSGSNTLGVVNLGERFLIVALMMLLLLFKCPALLQRALSIMAGWFMLYLLGATIVLSGGKLQQYTVARSSDTAELSQYVDDIYANSRHQFFNHRLFIYADRGLELLKPEPGVLPIDLTTSVIQLK